MGKHIPAQHIPEKGDVFLMVIVGHTDEENDYVPVVESIVESADDDWITTSWGSWSTDDVMYVTGYEACERLGGMVGKKSIRNALEKNTDAFIVWLNVA